MRKKVFGRKLARGRKARTALFRSLIWSLVEKGEITTTKAKAKAIQPDVDKLVSLAKKADQLNAKRLVLARLGNKTEVVEKLFSHYLPLFGSRNSGFTRIIALPRRTGDQAEMVKLEFVDKAKPAEKSSKPQVASK